MRTVLAALMLLAALVNPLDLARAQSPPQLVTVLAVGMETVPGLWGPRTELLLQIRLADGSVRVFRAYGHLQ